MNKWVITATAVLMGVCNSLFGGAEIDVGHHVLLPDTPGQEILLWVSGDEYVAGFELCAQIGDGMGVYPEPTFTDIVFLGIDSIWNMPVHIIEVPIHGYRQYARFQVVTQQVGYDIIPDGILLKMVIDTTGFFDGIFPLRLEGTDIGLDSKFFNASGSPVATDITNGTIAVGLPGDIDGSRRVDCVDYARFADEYLAETISPIGKDYFDFDGDNDIDLLDLLVFCRYWCAELP